MGSALSIFLLILMVSAIRCAYPMPFYIANMTTDRIQFPPIMNQLTGYFDKTYRFPITFVTPFASTPNVFLAQNNFNISMESHWHFWNVMEINETGCKIKFESSANLSGNIGYYFSSVSYLAFDLPELQVCYITPMLQWKWGPAYAVNKTATTQYFYRTPRLSPVLRVLFAYSIIGSDGNYRGLDLKMIHNLTYVQVNLSSTAGYTAGYLRSVRISFLVIQETPGLYYNYMTSANNSMSGESLRLVGKPSYMAFVGKTETHIYSSISGPLAANLSVNLNLSDLVIEMVPDNKQNIPRMRIGYLVMGRRACPKSFTLGGRNPECICNGSAFNFYNSLYSETECQTICPTKRHFVQDYTCLLCINRYSLRCETCNKDRCLICSAGAEYRTASNSCQCLQGFCQATNGSCIKDSRNCKECTEIATCTACMELDYLINQQCKACHWTDFQAWSSCSSDQMSGYFVAHAGPLEYTIIVSLILLPLILIVILIYFCYRKYCKKQSSEQSNNSKDERDNCISDQGQDVVTPHKSASKSKSLVPASKLLGAYPAMETDVRMTSVQKSVK